MIKILGKIPHKVCVAVSGGPDSMAILDFLVRGGREVVVAHFNHGTEHGKEAEEFVKNYCEKNNLKLFLSKAERNRTKDESPEEYWRNMRYDFFHSLNQDMKIITCHCLDDQVEQWIMTSLHGESRLIPYSNGNIFRPFMSTPKEDFLNWCKRKEVPYLIDPSNSSDKYMRSYVRINLIPHALKVNPGLYKVVRKKVEKQFETFKDTNSK